MTEIMTMERRHTEEVLGMMRVFYTSEAVFTNGSEEIFAADIENCVSGSPYLEGYVFEENGEVQGYAMVAKSFSTEFGKPCMWLEDLYLKPEHCGKGLGSCFMNFLGEKYPHAVLRLEVEAENERAVHVYEKSGFTVLPYMEMKKE